VTGLGTTGRALGYGLLAARRRARLLLLPGGTVAAGAFLLVLVVALMPSVRRQGEAFGNGAAVGRAVIVISVIVLLTGALEVAIAATRSVAQRARELGVLASCGVPGPAIVCSLMVEPVATAASGATVGAVLGAAAAAAGSVGGWTAGSVAPGTVVPAMAGAVAMAVVSAALASAVPSWRAARRPPLSSLTR
jgi:ABC-type antimicrobial peptide transport system permease subunit